MKHLWKKFFGAKEQPAGSTQKSRSPRLRFPLMDQSFFVASNGKQFPVRNLSDTGMALVSDGERFPEEMNGNIQVGEHKVYVELLVVRRNGNEVGLSIVDGAAEVGNLLRNVFAEEMHFLDMTEVDARHQKAVEDGKPRWFYAPGNYELFLVEDEAGTIVRFELEWGGNVLGYKKNGFRFGSVNKDNREDMSYARSALIQWRDGVTEAEKRKAIRIIENITALDSATRERLQGLLK